MSIREAIRKKDIELRLNILKLSTLRDDNIEDGTFRLGDIIEEDLDLLEKVLKILLKEQDDVEFYSTLERVESLRNTYNALMQGVVDFQAFQA